MQMQAHANNPPDDSNHDRPYSSSGYVTLVETRQRRGQGATTATQSQRVCAEGLRAPAMRATEAIGALHSALRAGGLLTCLLLSIAVMDHHP